MDDLEFPVRMASQLIENQHIVYTRLICRSTRLLKRRESAEEVLEHILILLLRISCFHKSSKTLVVSTKILIFTNFITKLNNLSLAKLARKHEGKRVSFIFTVHH